MSGCVLEMKKGALPLSDKGICCIDNIDKAEKFDEIFK